MKKIEIGLEEVLATIVAIPVIAIVVLIIFGVFCLTGFVIRDLWLWFMVPLGLPVIGISHALGIHLLVKSCWQFKPTSNDKWSVVKDVSAMWMVWFVGWVIHKIMIGEIHWP